MALTDLERRRCERDLGKFMERRRPPPHVRPQLDIGCRISGQSVEIFEIDGDSGHYDGLFQISQASTAIRNLLAR